CETGLDNRRLAGRACRTGSGGQRLWPHAITSSHRADPYALLLPVRFAGRSSVNVEGGLGSARGGLRGQSRRHGCELGGSCDGERSAQPGCHHRQDYRRRASCAGKVENIARGVMAIGLLDARWLKLAFVREGEPVRMRTVAVQRGESTLTLTCSGGSP